MTFSTRKLTAACLLMVLALLPLTSAQYYNSYYYPYHNYPYNYYNYNNGGYGYNNGYNYNGYNNGYGYNNYYNRYPSSSYYNYYSNGYYPYYNNYYSGSYYSPRAHHSLGMPNIGMGSSLGGLFLMCSTKNCAG